MRYLLATPDLTGQEAARLILDAAALASAEELPGLETALAAILSADTRPASEYIAAARARGGRRR